MTSAQQPSFQTLLASLQNPCVVLLGPTEEHEGPRAAWRMALAHPGVVDFEVTFLVLDPGRHREGWAWLHGRHALQGKRWALFAPGERLLAAGVEPPKGEQLQDLLEAAGAKSTIRELRAFLKMHPRHVDARADLVHLLRKRAISLLATFDLQQRASLTPEEDAYIWGEYAKELEACFADDGWVTLPEPLGINALLPTPKGIERDPLVKQSSLLRATLLRQHPKVLDLLRAFPGHPQAWLFLMLLDSIQAKGQILSSLATIDLLDTPFVLPSPAGWLGKAVCRDARETGDWKRATPLLRTLWHIRHRSLGEELDMMESSEPRNTSRQASVQEGTPAWLVQDTWDRSLAPYIEGLVSVGQASEVEEVLASLEPRWGLMDVRARVANLAKALGRPDLSARWQRACRLEQPPIPRKHHVRAFPLVYANQSADISLEKWFVKGFEMYLTPADAAWRRWLGWSDDQPHWALVDIEDKVLLRGDRLPPEDVFNASVSSLNLQTRLNRLETLVSEHPENLQAKLVYAQEVLSLGLKPPFIPPGQVASFVPGPRPSVLGDLAESYFKCLEEVLEHEHGTAVLTCDSNPAMWFRRSQVNHPTYVATLERIARRVLPRLETELERRPTSVPLWKAWLAFAQVVDQPLRPLLEALPLSPMTRPGQWPPKPIRTQYVDMLREDKKWRSIVSFLKPEWQAFVTSIQGVKATSTPGSHLDRWEQLLVPLVEAHLRLGAGGEADTLMQTWATWKLKPGDVESLCKLARDLQFDNLAQSWEERFPPDPYVRQRPIP